MSDLRTRHRRAVRRRRVLNGAILVAVVVALGASALAVREYVLVPEPALIVDSATGAYPADVADVVDAASVEREPPRSITIGDLELWAPVVSVGLADNGELEVPDEKHVGWYEYGSAPGLPGATVLAAHVTWNRTIGPFLKLGELDPGAIVEVRLQDGVMRSYQVVERTMYPKDELPADRIWTTRGDETLVLITCGGSYNSNIRRYRDNIVVYAVPVHRPHLRTLEIRDLDEVPADF